MTKQPIEVKLELAEDQGPPNLSALIAILFAVLAIGISLGLAVPLVALILEARGEPAWVIGLNAAMTPLAIVLVGPFAPKLMARFGVIRSAFIGLIVTTIGLAAFGLNDHLVFWFILRFINGAASALPWIATEASVNLIANDRWRGRYLGYYVTSLSLGVAVGPLLIPLLGTEGATPFLVGAGIMAMSLPLLAQVKLPSNPAHNPDSPPELKLLAVLLLAPLTMFCGFAAGFEDFAMFSLIPVYAVKHGADAATATYFTSMFVAGGIVFQPLIGILADKINRLHLMGYCAGAGALGAVILPFVIDHWTVWPLLLTWGGIVFGLYTVGLALLGQEFTGQNLAVANTMYVIIYNLGSLGGPPIAGAMMDVNPTFGLPMTVASLCFAAVLSVFLRRPGKDLQSGTQKG